MHAAESEGALCTAMCRLWCSWDINNRSATSPQPHLTAQVELSSEGNLFFHYVHDMDAKAFQKLQVGDSQCS